MSSSTDYICMHDDVHNQEISIIILRMLKVTFWKWSCCCTQSASPHADLLSCIFVSKAAIKQRHLILYPSTPFGS